MDGIGEEAMKDKVNILGTEYKIEIRDANTPDFENRCGWCDWQQKKIAIGDPKTIEEWKDEPEDSIEYKIKATKRHEIIHAFLYESGLHANSASYYEQWALNEEMIDWFAIQSPKIFKAFKDVGCL